MKYLLGIRREKVSWIAFLTVTYSYRPSLFLLPENLFYLLAPQQLKHRKQMMRFM